MEIINVANHIDIVQPRPFCDFRADMEFDTLIIMLFLVFRYRVSDLNFGSFFMQGLGFKRSSESRECAFCLGLSAI